jgi:hypothetical protein
MNRFAGLPLDEAAEPQEKVLFVLPSVVEEKFTAVECLDEGGGPFEETKYKRRKGSKTAFNIKNKELNLAKQKRMEAWQLAKQKRMEAWQLAEKQAQCKLIEFENKAKKGISVSLTENYNDIILKLLHIIHKDKPLSEIEKICKSFIEKLNQFWNEYIQNEMYEERYEYMVKEQDMELALKGIFWCEDSMSYY